MANDHATPVPPRALFVLRGGAGTDDAVPEASPATLPAPVEAGAGDGTEMQPVPVSVPMTVPERASLAARHWATVAADGAGRLWLNPGRILYVLWHGQPESLAGHRVYVKSRAWVPPDLDGKAASFITGAGIVYHLLIARPLKTVCLIVSGAAERPLRLAGLIALLLVLIFAVLPHVPF